MVSSVLNAECGLKSMDIIIPALPVTFALSSLLYFLTDFQPKSVPVSEAHNHRI
jgi:hypothetical protein